ncbi:hypothetical protein P43SY_007594 [Pythium insidiosum]|uniref:FYVE-type domain-containing protein n=1 Tax=Pythium insidiosum TaxID=114742 RepID=A0AAD5LS42_PYTIN|nr:hypothetical protein P43SY_007594 [Pythium insidiosum]
MPPGVESHALEDEVRELIVAKARAESLASSLVTDDSNAAAVAAALSLAPDELQGKFEQAEQFVSVVLSRLHRDTASIEPRLWVLQNHGNQLWALRQQAVLGSCEASRGSKEYQRAVAEAGPVGGLVAWPPCCLRMAGDSKLRQWQDLGDMTKAHAQARYIGLLTELAPDWSDPLGADAALLRTWTPDSDSDRCAVCDEVFTFLNRRHHCRRCSNLVCAVCSPHYVPLRVFAQTTARPQRVCSACVRDMGLHAQQATLPDLRPRPSLPSVASAAALSLRKSSAPPEPDDDSERDASVSTATADTEAPAPPPVEALLQEASRQAPAALSVTISSTIHCGQLELLHGAGFRKTWQPFFFVLLIRKGSLGMFLHATDHIEKKKRPTAVFKLSGYTLRIRSQKRRPHQFRLAHATKKALQLAAASLEDMNLWIGHLIRAIDNANELESSSSYSHDGGDDGDGDGDGDDDGGIAEHEVEV